MTLEKAYKLGIKYGFTFNGVGPSLSVVDNKVGICINLLDEKFGYIKRNYSFDLDTEFEAFLKKYSYYLHNKEKENIFITLDNYEDMDAKIIYSYENEDVLKKEIEFKNKELILKDMKTFLENFIDNIELLRADIAEKILVEQDYYNKLDYYQNLLYKAYNEEYKDEVMHADKSYLDDFNSKVKEFDLNHKRDLASIITENITLEQLNETYKNLYNDCKSFLQNEEFINVLFDKMKFKNNIDVLNEMIEYLLNNPESDDNTEEQLADIKNNAKQIEYQDYKEQYFSKYLDRYEGINDSFNEKIFGGEEVKLLEYKRKSFAEEKRISDLKYLYDNLTDEQKNAIGLVHSPLKSILLYVIEHAYLKKGKFNFDREDFKHIYETVNNGLKNSENLVFKLKYFKNINIDSYDEFIKSIVKASKIICSAYNKLPFELKLYSLNYDACMICASDIAIKSGSDTVNVINAKEGCLYIYSPIKITYDKQTNLYSTSQNNNVIYFPRYLNTSKKKDEIITLNLFEESYGIDKINNTNILYIDNFKLDKSIKYKYSDLFPKQKK